MAFIGKAIKGSLAIIGIGGAGLVLSLEKTVRAEIALHPPKYPWSHRGFYDSLDSASVRRGYQVYKQVCAACHSLKFFAFRHLEEMSHSKDQAKKEAASFMVEDGPNDKGEMFMRPGILSDRFPKPYANEEAAKFANGGAMPPDLSLIVRARHGREDYIFSLLLGYVDPPAGVKLEEGLHYNPYFPGKRIAMVPPLYNEIIEYKDGTDANRTQLAKDVTTFLTYTAEKNFDERKKRTLKFCLFYPFVLAAGLYMYLKTWAPMRTSRYFYSTLKEANHAPSRVFLPPQK